MEQTSYKKIVTALSFLCTHPREALSWLRRGKELTDREVVRQSYWILGNAKRVALSDIESKVKEVDVLIPRVFDRTFRTSITIYEANALAALVRARKPKKILEIGTFDGNTTNLLARNGGEECSVVTVDLPPDFDLVKNKSELADTSVKINMTPRNMLASQYKDDAISAQITQVYGDSAVLDWGTFGGPFDFIFIDGCHKASYVRSDSKNAFANLASNGVIVWHDYGEIPDVSHVVDEIAKEQTQFHTVAIEGTRLAISYR